LRWDDIHITGTGAWLPEATVTTAEAVRTGRYGQDEADRSLQERLVVADGDDRTPDFAVRAGRQALDRAGTGPDQVAAVLHGVLMHNGIDVWNSVSYVQRELGAANAFGCEIRAGSNGGLAALELGAALLRGRPDSGPVLVTCADAWRAPYFDRWRADSGLVFGDGGSALVASREQEGFACLASLVTTQDPELEGLHRGNEDFGPYRHSARQPIDLFRRAQEFMTTMPKEEVWERGATGLRTAVERATDEAGTSVKEADHVVLPHFGAHLLARQCLEPLGLADFDRTTWEFARRVGHIGAGDQLAGLNHLAASGALAPGQKVVLVGVGGGFNWTCAVLEILHIPSWADTTS
jgi:3-oxoacyl-[acyl-carrier-protein] synthase-3